jgi:hypothetical protein
MEAQSSRNKKFGPLTCCRSNKYFPSLVLKSCNHPSEKSRAVIVVSNSEIAPMSKTFKKSNELIAKTEARREAT